MSSVCFLAESQVGIGALAKTLKPIALASPDPKVHWVDVTYEKPGGLLERLPLPPRVRGTARGFLQTREGVNSQHFDALLFLTQNPAVLQPHVLRRIPSLLWTDVTPVQLDELAEHYNHPKDDNAIAHRLKHELELPLVATFHTLARVKAETGDPEPARRDRAEAAPGTRRACAMDSGPASSALCPPTQDVKCGGRCRTARACGNPNARVPIERSASKRGHSGQKPL